MSANVFIAKQEKCGFKTGMATRVGVGCLGVLAVSVFFGGLWWENGGLEKRESDGGDGTGDEREFRNVF